MAATLIAAPTCNAVLVMPAATPACAGGTSPSTVANSRGNATP